jgi:hypothetical protein
MSFCAIRRILFKDLKQKKGDASLTLKHDRQTRDASFLSA